MNESNGNCCCGCQYSTPPWWVTMGFIPPYSYQGGGQTVHTATPGTATVGGTTTTTTTGGTKGTGTSGNPLGTILGDVVGGIGSLLGGLL